jgi:pseudo-rSAM protein
MNLIIRVEPYVYLKKNENTILFYNTINGESIEFSFTNEKYFLLDNILNIHSVCFTESLIQLKRSLEKKYMATIVKKDDLIFSINFFDKIINEFRQKIHQSIFSHDDLKKCLSEITICLNSADQSIPNIWYLSKQFEVFSNMGKGFSEINLSSVEHFFSTFSFSNVNLLNIVGHNLLNSSILFDTLNFFKDITHIRIYLMYSEFISYENGYDNDYDNDKLNYYIICDDIFREHFVYNYHQFLRNKKIFFNYYINSLNDILFLNENDDIFSQFKFIIHPYYNENFDFLFELISYTKEDIFSNIKTQMNIIRNSLLNELLFGKIVIHNDGSIFANIQDKPIGNINEDSISNAFENLIKDSRSWLYSREKFSSCNNCLYNTLCPPVSYIELLTNKVFCDFV